MKHAVGPNMAAALEDRRPGCCLACDEPLVQLPKTKPAVVHQHPDCLRYYHALYAADRHQRERDAAEVAAAELGVPSGDAARALKYLPARRKRYAGKAPLTAEQLAELRARVRAVVASARRLEALTTIGVTT